MWRVWIEIGAVAYQDKIKAESPSVWRVWIEMGLIAGLKPSLYVTLRVEGVD